MPRPRTPSDLLVTNGWWLEMPGLVSPHFETVDGIGVNSNTVDIVDAGTNIKYKFSAQILEFQELSLTRTDDGSSDDTALQALFDKCLKEGFKFPANLVKTHNGNEVYRIAFVGFRFVSVSHPTLDIQGEEKHTSTYTATIDYYYKV